MASVPRWGAEKAPGRGALLARTLKDKYEFAQWRQASIPDFLQTRGMNGLREWSPLDLPVKQVPP